MQLSIIQQLVSNELLYKVGYFSGSLSKDTDLINRLVELFVINIQINNISFIASLVATMTR